MKRCLAAGLLALSSLAGAQEIDRQGSWAFTADDMRMAEGMVLFLADAKLTDAEKLRLKNELTAEFREDPAGFVEGVGQVRSILSEAKKLTDPAQLAVGRISMVTLFYGLVKDMPGQEQPALLKMVFAKNPILAYDEANQIVLTQKDLDNSLRFLWFSNGVPEPTEAQKKQMKALSQAIAGSYLQLSPAHKQFLALGSITWPVLEHYWKSATPAQRQQLMTGYQTRYAQAAPQVQAQPLPDWSGQALDADTYKFLSRMSTQNHLSMLNGIEAMGGSDDYWTIRPAGW